MGANPSYIWRSVYASQDLIKRGVLCRVGNGNAVNILNVPWLPVETDPYIHTANVALQNQKVNSLMITGEKIWDEDLIRDVFDDRDANIILNIPLNEEVKDNWYWRNDKLGAYTVK